MWQSGFDGVDYVMMGRDNKRQEMAIPDIVCLIKAVEDIVKVLG